MLLGDCKNSTCSVDRFFAFGSRSQSGGRSPNTPTPGGGSPPHASLLTFVRLSKHVLAWLAPTERPRDVYECHLARKKLCMLHHHHSDPRRIYSPISTLNGAHPPQLEEGGMSTTFAHPIVFASDENIVLELPIKPLTENTFRCYGSNNYNAPH